MLQRLFAFILAALWSFAVASAQEPEKSSLADPAYFHPPKGWTRMELPPNAPVDFDWLSPHFRGTGENIALSVSDATAGATLDSIVKDATKQTLEQGRSIASSHAHATCSGTQPGWMIDVRIPIGSRTVSQIQQFSIKASKVYMVMYTHSASGGIDDAVLQSIDSLCP